MLNFACLLVRNNWGSRHSPPPTDFVFDAPDLFSEGLRELSSGKLDDFNRTLVRPKSVVEQSDLAEMVDVLPGLDIESGQGDREYRSDNEDDVGGDSDRD